MTTTIRDDDTQTADQLPALEHVDPATLIVDTNIRTTRLDKPFTASVKQHGVLVPVVAVRTPEGLRVRFGHRRTIAAVEAGLKLIPVYVTGSDDADDVARIVGQWTENEHRAALTTRERIGAVEQLALLGLSAGQIAHRTRTGRAEVADALTASGSALAVKAAERYAVLTLEQSAVLAEFDGPNPDEEVVTALISAAHEGQVQFERAVEVAHDRAADRAARQQAEAELATAGVDIIERPEWNSTVKRLAHLRTADGDPMTEQDHATCSGHAAWLEADWTRATVAAGRVDQNDGNDDAWERCYQPVYVCTDPVGNGHATGSGTPADTLPTMRTEDGAETARQTRRETIANNKAWRQAEPIRRKWLMALLARKTAPKGSAAFLAATLIAGYQLASQNRLAHDLLGMTASDDLAEAAERTTDPRALVITLAVVIAGYESALRVDTWRSSTTADLRYFAWLAANGYPLSEVEELVASTV